MNTKVVKGLQIAGAVISLLILLGMWQLLTNDAIWPPPPQERPRIAEALQESHYLEGVTLTITNITLGRVYYTVFNGTERYIIISRGHLEFYDSADWRVALRARNYPFVDFEGVHPPQEYVTRFMRLSDYNPLNIGQLCRIRIQVSTRMGNPWEREFHDLVAEFYWE
ncbi:MAG: hypothetical protein FWC89_11635 [Defluviitaleaceae bacterium]|nr:hypothetical protein [Defluviitaleaceae bacterium]